MSILAAERQQQILERLGRDGRVLAAALAEAFSTSEDTIRRDLRDLAGRGLCRRVYGGALPVSPASNSAQVRAGEAADRKAALGQALAALVAPGSLVFVDSGSTNLAAAKAFPEDLRLTVATHDPAIAAALLAEARDHALADWRPGRSSRSARLSEAGLWPTSRRCARIWRYSACARSILWRASPRLIRRMRRSNGRFCATPAASPRRVLNEKLETRAPFAIGRAESLDCVVLEADAPESVAVAFAERGISVRRARPASPDKPK